MNEVDRANADYLALLEAQGAALTDEEAALVARWSNIRAPEPAPEPAPARRAAWRFPWLVALLGAALWLIAILAIIGGITVFGL